MYVKIKSHGDEVTDFYDKEIPKVDSYHICLVVISLDFVNLEKIKAIIGKSFLNSVNILRKK